MAGPVCYSRGRNSFGRIKGSARDVGGGDKSTEWGRVLKGRRLTPKTVGPAACFLPFAGSGSRSAPAPPREPGAWASPPDISGNRFSSPEREATLQPFSQTPLTNHGTSQIASKLSRDRQPRLSYVCLIVQRLKYLNKNSLKLKQFFWMNLLSVFKKTKHFHVPPRSKRP